MDATRFETLEESLHEAVQKRREEIISRLGKAPEECVYLTLHQNMFTFLCDLAFHDQWADAGEESGKRRELCRELTDKGIIKVCWMPTMPSIGIRANAETLHDGAIDSKSVGQYMPFLHHGELLVKMEGFRDFIILAYTHITPDGDRNFFRYAVLGDVADIKVYARIDTIHMELEEKLRLEYKVIDVFNRSPIKIPKAAWVTWDDLFVTEDVKKNLIDDIKFFFARKDWYRSMRIPWKRGYLLTGDPGNGKSLTCRIMATFLNVRSSTFDFSDDESDNSTLTECFKSAQTHAPSVLFLEDIDRVYDGEKHQSKITMDHVLNCLDGISANDGVVVVATANNPKALDPAVLKRPGRFDRVITFAAPDATLRHRYLTHLFKTSTNVTKKVIDEIVAASDGMSMAFIKEVFIASAGEAFNEGHAEILGDDALAGLYKVSSQFDHSPANNRRTGFSV